jgi:hypothetical protein
MNDIIQAVMQRTGLSEEKAEQAVEATVDLLKERLPEPASSMLDQVTVGRMAGSPPEAARHEAATEMADEPSSKLGQATDAVKNIFNR